MGESEVWRIHYFQDPCAPSQLQVGENVITKFSYYNFHPLGVVTRWRDPQLQEGENYW